MALHATARGELVQNAHPKGRSLAAVSYTGSAGTSGAAADGETIVRVVLTTAGFYEIGATATTASTYLPADTVEYRAIVPGETVSAIQLSSGGNLYVEFIKPTDR